MLVAMAGSCLAEDQAKEETPWYARPIVTDSETLALLDDIGANSVGFRFHLPSDHKLIVTILAKDEKGSRIEKLSGVHTLTPQEKGIPFDNNVRLVRIDPGKFTENYQGKEKWVIHIGNAIQETWQPKRYAATGSRDSWWQGNKFDGVTPGTDYLLWRIKAYPEDLRKINPDSPATFSIQIHFRYVPMTVNDSYWTTSHGDDEQEYNRAVKDPRVKDGRGKK
jgi:hypothetical protein